MYYFFSKRNELNLSIHELVVKCLLNVYITLFSNYFKAIILERSCVCVCVCVSCFMCFFRVKKAVFFSVKFR